jgi:hypothetical protein
LHDSRWQVRLAIVVAVAVYGSFAWLDVWMAPDLAEVFLTIRILVAAVFGLALAVTFAPVGLTIREFFIAIAILSAAAGILRMMELATAVVSVRYFAGLLLVILAAHSMFRLRFQSAMLVSLLVVGAWALHTGIEGEMPWWEYMNSQFFLIRRSSWGCSRATRERFARRLAGEARRRWWSTRRASACSSTSSRADRGAPQSRGRSIADGFAEATIMFVDLVDFTKLSSELDPAASSAC